MRRRIEMGMNRRPMSFEDKKKAFMKEKRIIEERMRKERAERQEKDKEEPF
jgi:hypothetical protein